jgi:chromosome segregation ATPase
MDGTDAECARLKKELAAALAANTDKSGESEALQKELVAAEEQLAARDADVRTLEARLAALRKDVDNANARAARIDAERVLIGMQLGAMRTGKEKLEAEIAVLKQTIESLEALRREDQPQPDVTAGGDDTPTVRREAEDVRAALADMPGYSRLTPDKQIELARRLENGECAADALKATLGRVPAIALRNLIRDLGSKC